ncbi:MAG: hypothetical protein KA801_02535 [Syntrophorhabdaceae bacterium]|nr:hypothetical protein [Syntrophorhabdaceae bacterium]
MDEKDMERPLSQGNSLVPMPGGLVRITNSTDDLVPDGTLGVIEGKVGQVMNCCLVTFRFSPAPFLDDTHCTASGGPAFIILSRDLVPVGSQPALFWKWKGLPCEGGGDYYRKEANVFEYDHALRRKMPRSLPVMAIGDTRHYVDCRLGQIRSIDNPHSYVDIIDGWLKWEPHGHAYCLVEDGLIACPLDKGGAMALDHGGPKARDIDFAHIDEEEAATCRDIMEVLKLIENEESGLDNQEDL